MIKNSLGKNGDDLTSILFYGNEVTVNNGSLCTLCQILVPKGNWDISGIVGVDTHNPGYRVRDFDGCINTSAALPLHAMNWGHWFNNTIRMSFGTESAHAFTVPIPDGRVYLSADTTFYLLGSATNTGASTISFHGQIRAKRFKG